MATADRPNGEGPVFVNGGTLGGRGIITGAVTVGGQGSVAFLAPSAGSNKTMTLTSWRTELRRPLHL